MKKVFLTTVLSLMMCMVVCAQNYEWKNPPKFSEKVIGSISMEHSGGFLHVFEGITGVHKQDCRNYLSDNEMYESLLEKAKKEYGKTHPALALRNFSSSFNEKKETSGNSTWYNRTYYSKATVVIPDVTIGTNEHLPEVTYKALRNVPVGSRMAVDRVLVTNNMDEEQVKDQLLNLLLDNGYKVVAKEYLEKLYKEQQDQQSGIYNERTTVQENNFSAVGYFVNVKVTETSIRVQIVNVSTGEYEGNATVNF